MKAAIVCDDWKLSIFREKLTAAGFTFTEQKFGPSVTTLQVPYGDLKKLAPVVRAAQAACAELVMRQGTNTKQ